MAVVIPILRRGVLGDGVVLRLSVLPTAALLIVVHLVVTAGRLARSWWWQDDLNLLAVADGPLSLSMLLTDYNGHLVPGTFLLGWLVGQVGPFAYWPAALAVLLLVAGCDIAMLALLRRLFGARPGILLPLGMFCATTLTLSATLWWAAAMQWLPITLGLIVAMYGHVGFVRDGRSRDAAIALGGIAFGLAFFEKALLITVVLGLFSWAYGVGGSWVTRPWRLFLAHPVYWVLHAALAGGFTVAYLARVMVTTGESRAASTADQFRLVRNMVLESFLPSLLGGPFSWEAKVGNTWPTPSAPFAVAVWVLVAVFVVVTVRARRGVWRAWALLGSFLGTSVALVAWTRLGLIGPVIGRDPRYLTDATAMAAICLGLALMPLRAGLDRAQEPPPGLSSGLSPGLSPARRAGRRAATGPDGSPSTGGTLPVIGLVTVLFMTVGGLVSGEAYMSQWTQNPTKAYLQTLTASLASAEQPVHLLPDEAVPETIMQATFEEDRLLSHVTKPLERRPRFGPWSAAPSTVDPTGQLRPADVDATPVQLPPGVCTSNRRIVIGVPGEIIQWRWTLKLGYLADRDTPARVRIGTGPPVQVQLAKGVNTVFVQVDGGGSRQIVVDGLAPAARVCLGGYSLGVRVVPAA